MKQVLECFLRSCHELACTPIEARNAFERVAFRPRSHTELGGKACGEPERSRQEVLRCIVEALSRLRSRSCIIDGEAIACGDDGIAHFDRIRYRHHHDASVFLYAFDLIELNGEDLRNDPLDVRKATLASLLARTSPGL